METIGLILYQPAEVIRKIQDQGVRRLMSLCRNGHSFYQRRFRKKGIDFSSIQTIDDLELLPLTSKSDYMEQPEDFVLKIPEAPMFERIIYNLLYTAGTTTGHPTPFYNTPHDYYLTLTISKRIAEIVGITPNDTIVNTYPLTNVPHLTFFAAFWYATVTGAKLVSTLTGTPHSDFPVTNSSEKAARMVQESEGTIIWGNPSFIRRLLIMAEEMGLRYPYVRLAAVSSEPCSLGLREDIVQRLGRLGAMRPHVNNRFGFTEISAVFVECDPEGKAGFHNPAPDNFFLEVVDEQAGKRLQDGEAGFLTITHLNRRGTVLIRYLTGDIVTLSREPCPYCGRTAERITSQPYRKSDLIKFKGTLINPKPLLTALSEVSEIKEFQVIFTKVDPIDPLSPDHLQIKIATDENEDGIREKITKIGVQSVEMRPEVLFVNQNEIYDPDKSFKSKRIIDLRNQKT